MKQLTILTILAVTFLFSCTTSKQDPGKPSGKLFTGFTDMIAPTSGVFGVLGMARGGWPQSGQGAKLSEHLFKIVF